jgi:Mg-chelatase subunit ChlD
MWDATAEGAMPPARRVQLAPPAPWSEDALIDAARALDPAPGPLRPGDELGGLLVLAVDPAPGAAFDAETEIDIQPRPREAVGASVDLVILLDASESMAAAWSAEHARLTAARASIAAFLRAPSATVASVALFEYAKEPRLVAGPAPPRALALPEDGHPKGRAAPATAIDAAVAHLASSARAGASQAILLLTDGVADVKALVAAAQRAGRLKIPIHSIVFAPETDPVFDEIARASGGSTQRAALPLTIEFEHQPGGDAP